MKAAARRPATRRVDAAAKAAFRDEVVAIARELFAGEGFRSVSMRAIATRAGCSPMALYKYFPNKLALLRYIWADIFAEAFARTETAMKRARGPAAKLRAYWRAWARYWLAYPQHYRVVFLNQDVADANGASATDADDGPYFANGALARAHLATLAAVFADGMAVGAFRDMRPEQCVRILITQLLGLMHAVITIPELDWGSIDALIDSAADASLRGFARAP